MNDRTAQYDWDVLSQLDNMSARYFGKAAYKAAKYPNARFWYVYTNDGTITIPNYEVLPFIIKQAQQSDQVEPPFGRIFSAAISPTYLLGGPNPLTLGLLGAVYGGILTGLGKPIVDAILGRDEDMPLGERIRRGFVTGALLGVTPAAALALYRILNKREGSSVLKELTAPWPREEFNKKAQFVIDQVNDIFGARVGPAIYEPHWRDIILNDPSLKPKEKALAAGPVYATAIASGSSIITPGQVAVVAGNTLLGSIFGRVLGNLAGFILGLPPDTRKWIQDSGTLAGLVKGIVKTL